MIPISELEAGDEVVAAADGAMFAATEDGEVAQTIELGDGERS